MIIKNAKILNELFQFQAADLILGKIIEKIIPKADFSGTSADESMNPGADQDVLDLKGDLLIPGLTVKDHIARTCDGTLAGSTTNLMGMVKKAVSFGIPLESAVRMASATPAAAAGLDKRFGSISMGKAANLVWCKEDLTVCSVIHEGKVQYSSASSIVQ